MDKKLLKQTSLLDAAFKLFTEKDVKSTSIQEISDEAKVGKGTFYLYFKDKYEIRDILIEKKSRKLFSNAISDLRKTDITKLDDEVIFIIDHIINELKANPLLLKFISKNLSWGVYSQTVNRLYKDNELEEEGMYQLFLKGIERNNIKLKDPSVTLYMIIELVSSTCFNSILYDKPLPIEEFKSFLYPSIKAILTANE